MKRRAEREKQFDEIEQRLYKAGEYVLHAAKANQDMFDTSVSAVAEALGIPEDVSEPKLLSMSTLNTNQFYTEAIAERDAASTHEEYIAAEKKIQLLEEIEISKEERKARSLEAQIRTINAKKLISSLLKDSSTEKWTESELKKKYKTIGAACQGLGIEARTWKDVLEKANQKSS